MNQPPFRPNVEAELALLEKCQIPFIYANGVVRIQVPGKPKASFWPSTGRWRIYLTGPGAMRITQAGLGAATLVKLYQNQGSDHLSWAERQATLRERKRRIADEARNILSAARRSFSFSEKNYYIKMREVDKPAVDYWPTTGLWYDRRHNRKYWGTPEQFLSWYEKQTNNPLTEMGDAIGARRNTVTQEIHCDDSASNQCCYAERKMR